jgi:hypothetical protein
MSIQYISNVCVPEMVVYCDVHLTKQWNAVVELDLLNNVLTVGVGDSSSVECSGNTGPSELCSDCGCW